MAKWDISTIEADMAEIRESVDKLQQINRFQARKLQALDDYANKGWDEVMRRDLKIERLEEQLRQAQQSLRNARDSALEEAWLVVMQRVDVALRIGTEDEEGSLQEAADAIRALKSTTQGSRE